MLAEVSKLSDSVVQLYRVGSMLTVDGSKGYYCLGRGVNGTVHDSRRAHQTGSDCIM